MKIFKENTENFEIIVEEEIAPKPLRSKKIPRIWNQVPGLKKYVKRLFIKNIWQKKYLIIFKSQKPKFKMGRRLYSREELWN